MDKACLTHRWQPPTSTPLTKVQCKKTISVCTQRRTPRKQNNVRVFQVHKRSTTTMKSSRSRPPRPRRRRRLRRRQPPGRCTSFPSSSLRPTRRGPDQKHTATHQIDQYDTVVKSRAKLGLALQDIIRERRVVLVRPVGAPDPSRSTT